MFIFWQIGKSFANVAPILANRFNRQEGRSGKIRVSRFDLF